MHKGLEPGLEVYAGGATHNWHTGTNNWNQVCNGGLGTGALAIADVAPEIAGRVLHEALGSLPLAMGHYAPDGASTEGVTYWEYGSRYNILFLSALETALGTDYGLTRLPGFAESGAYQMYMSGAGRMSMDCRLSLRRMSSRALWLGRRYGCPSTWYRYWNPARPHGAPARLFWFDDSAKTFDLATLPWTSTFAETAPLRSSGGGRLVVASGGWIVPRPPAPGRARSSSTPSASADRRPRERGVPGPPPPQGALSSTDPPRGTTPWS